VRLFLSIVLLFIFEASAQKLSPNFLKKYNLKATCQNGKFGAVYKNRFKRIHKFKHKFKSQRAYKKAKKKGKILCATVNFVETPKATPDPTPTITPTATPTEDLNITCDDSLPAETPIARELEEGNIIRDPWRYNKSAPQPTPTPPSPPAGFSHQLDGQNKILKYTGSFETEELEGYMKIPLSIDGLENGENYLISYRHKVENVHCYNSLKYPGHNANAYIADTKGIYCGIPSAYLVIRRNGAVWGEYLRLTTLPRWDGGYTWNERRDWAEEKMLFRLPKTGTITLELRLEMKGFNGDFLIDNVAISRESLGFEMQLDGGEFSTNEKNYNFRDVRIVKASPKCVETDNLSIETAGIHFKTEMDSLVVTRDGRKISKLQFESGALVGLKIRSKPPQDTAGNVILSNDKVALKIGADGMVVGKAKEDIAISVTGNEDNRSDNSCPECYKKFYFNYEAGVVFESNIESYDGFLFSQIFPYQDVTALKVNAYSSAIPAPTPSGPSYSDRYGDWRYNEQYLRDVIERPLPEVIYVPDNWTSLPQGAKTPSRTWELNYQIPKRGQFILSAFPVRTIDPKAMCGERFQSGLSVDPKNSDSGTNFINRYLEASRVAPNHLNILFLNWTKYSRAINDNIPQYYFMEYYLDGTTRRFRYVAPDPLALDCPSSSTFLGVCKRKFQKGSDIHGPYYVTQELDLQGVSEELHVINFLQQSEDPIFYIGLQFFYSKNPEVILENLQEIFDRYKPFGLKGFYFDGAIPAEPLKTLEVLRGTRRIVGEEGVVIHHYSKPNELLPQTDHYFIPSLTASLNARLLGEGVKKEWDLRGSVGCPKVWGLMYGGKGTVVSALMPELRGVDFWKTTDSEFFYSSVPPRDQTRAQLNCGGQIFAPIHNEPLSATSSRKVFAFIEKSKSGINATGSPLRDKACMPTEASDPQCPNNGEDGYWSGLQLRCN